MFNQSGVSSSNQMASQVNQKHAGSSSEIDEERGGSNGDQNHQQSSNNKVNFYHGDSKS